MPVKITVFNTREEFTPILREMLSRYQLAGNGVTVRYQDPYRNPSLVDYYRQQGSPVTLNSIVVESENRLKVLESQDLFSVDKEAGVVRNMTAEQQITSAILSVSSQEKPEVEFLEGHNEEPSASLLSLFEQNNYRVTRKSPAVQGIGKDTKLLVIAAPTRDYSKEETTLLDEFMAGGGRVMAFLPPASEGLPNLREFFEEWGLGITGDVVVEKQLYTDGNPLNVVPIYGSHEINSYFARDKVTPVLPTVQALEQVYQQRGKISTQTVLYSSANSRKMSGEYEKAAEDGSAAMGPFPLALTSARAADDGAGMARIFLIGCKNVYADDLMNSENYGNAAFLTQVINWCTDTEVSIHIPAKSMEAPPIRILSYQALLIGAVLTLLIPAVILTAGLAVYLRRRHL